MEHKEMNEEEFDRILDEAIRGTHDGTYQAVRAKNISNLMGKKLAKGLGQLKACLDLGIVKDIPILGITTEILEEARERKGELMGKQQFKMLKAQKRLE